MPNNSPARAIFGAVQAEKWCAAYRVALVNAGVFLSLALAMFVLEPTSLAVILSAPALFFLGSLLSFLLMVGNGGALATVAWFVLGTGIFFGMGVVAGGLHVHPWSDTVFANDTQYLVRINLLNACSVMIALATAYPLANMQALKDNNLHMSLDNIEGVMQKIFPFILGICVIGVGLRFVLFPAAGNPVLGSLAAKIYLIIPAGLLLFGILWRSSGWRLRLVAGSVFLLEIVNGLACLTKYQVISAMLAFVVGMWLTRPSAKFILMTLMIMAFIFALINPLITLGRGHVDYNGNTNSIATRFAILVDVGNAYYLGNKNLNRASPESEDPIRNQRAMDFAKNQRAMQPAGERLRALGRRFDVASIQGYLVNEYDNGRPGKSMHDFLVVMIPRVLWPEKPIITRFGGELSAQYYNNPKQSATSTAPTYSAEAYWNHGPLGVVGVSILLGLGLGWFTRCWQFAMAGRDPAYFLMAFPAAIWASYVESWVVATYLGEFIIFVVILLVGRRIFARLSGPLKI